MSISSQMVNTVKVEKPTKPIGLDEASAPRPDYQVVDGQHAVPCNIQMRRGGQEVVHGKHQQRVRGRIYFDQDWGFVEAYRFTDENGKQYIVNGTGDAAGRGQLFWVDAEQLQ